MISAQEHVTMATVGTIIGAVLGLAIGGAVLGFPAAIASAVLGAIRRRLFWVVSVDDELKGRIWNHSLSCRRRREGGMVLIVWTAPRRS